MVSADMWPQPSKILSYLFMRAFKKKKKKVKGRMSKFHFKCFIGVKYGRDENCLHILLTIYYNGAVC